MKTVKKSIIELIGSSALFLFLLFASVVNTAYIASGVIIAIELLNVWDYFISKIHYDENLIIVRNFIGKKYLISWNEVTDIVEGEVHAGKSGKYNTLKITYRETKTLKKRKIKRYYSFLPDGVQELLEFYQNVLREKQKDYD